MCNTDFDCQWGQVCQNGICAKNDEVHWTCDGAFNEPHETCRRQPEKDGSKLYLNTLLTYRMKPLIHFSDFRWTKINIGSWGI